MLFDAVGSWNDESYLCDELIAMRKKATAIPVNHFGGEAGAGIMLDRIFFTDLPELADWAQPERHDRHSFFLVETGMVRMEIDFRKYTIKALLSFICTPTRCTVCWALNR